MITIKQPVVGLLNFIQMFYTLLFFLFLLPDKLAIVSGKIIKAGKERGSKTKQRISKPVITAMANSDNSTIPAGISVAKVPPSIMTAVMITLPICFEANTMASLGGK